MKRILLLAISICLHSVVFGQLEAWELSSQPGSQVSSNATTSASGIGTGVLQRGVGLTASGAAGSISSSGWFSSTSPTTLADAIANNDYYEFTLPMGTNMASLTSIGIVVRASNTGPNTATLRSSADGFTTNLGTIPITAASVLNTIPVSLLNLTGTVTFRLYGYGSAVNGTPAAGGTMRIGTSVVAADNDLIISGTVVICPSISATLATNTPLVCGAGTASIFFNITGGTAPYTVVYNNGSNNVTVSNYTNQSLINVGAGTYTAVSATDANGCSAGTVSGSVTIQISSGPAIGATSSDPTCANNNGQISLTITGGTTPYSFNWTASNGGSGIVQGQEDQTGLSAGSYAVTVSDAPGCTATGAFTLTLPANCGCPALATNITNATCGASNGSVTVVPTGGVPPFQFNIGGGPQNSPTFANLAAGTYTITVTGSSCTGATVVATVQTAPDVQAPVFTSAPPADITINCDMPLPAPATLTATDNCDPAPVVTLSTQTTAPNCPQNKTVTRTWTARDASNNTTQVAQVITVVDNQPPVFNQPLPPANLTVSCSSPVPLAATLTAADNCDPGAVPPVIFINEIHYDNTGGDVNEFVEVAGTAGIDLSQYQIILYNGNGGVTYDTKTLTGTIDNEGNGFGAVSFFYPVNGIQNGTPDGLALVKLPNTVIQFLSYEGPFLATNGPAAGMTATDIGVQELGTEPLGLSLQLTGSGQIYNNFTWTGPITATPGTLNAGQTLSALPGTITATLTETMMMGNCNGEMTIMRMYTASDACGNSTVFSQTIHVEDFTPPAFAPPLPQNITIECSAPVPAPATLTATDNCDSGTPNMSVWINEIHYDNTGTDTLEFIEVAGTAGTDLSGYSLFLYNGTGGGTYGSMTLSGTIDNESNGFGAVAFFYPVNGIQNGSPDGIALVHGGMVVQFLSYEGVFTAVGGPANGMPSTDIGVAEDGITNGVNTSVRLTGSGNTYSNFTWNAPAAATPGTINPGQSFIAIPTGLPVSFSQTSAPGTCPNTGTITRTWSVSDGCGNSTSLVQVITIQDSTPPVFTFVPASITQQCTANVPPVGTPTATDNCDPSVTIVYNGETVTPGSCLNSRNVLRKWTATDDCGNTKTATQLIAVSDIQGPALVCQNATVNLNILGTVSVTIPSLIQSLSDNCSPNASITVTPAGPLTFTCAQQGTTVPVTITAADECGNTSSCTAQVTINAFPRCTPKILITDPCVCKNNATTLDNGQFGETLKIESLSGKVWTITAINGLYAANSPAPPVAPTPIPVGTTFVENPANSGDYFLSGIHVDAIGYSITVKSQSGETLTISNSCSYPNPAITSNLDGPFCLYSNPVPLSGTPGDANIVSAGFTINGVAATVFNPGAGVGQYVIVYTVDGGTPKAAGANDPGCIQKIEKIVQVLETPSSLTCNDLVQISLDDSCKAVVNPDMILEGTYFCYDDYTVTITGLTGVPNYGNVVTGANIGQTLKATVKHLVSGNTCWGTIKVEDKLPPEMVCTPISLTCGTTNYQPDYLKDVLKISNAYPAVTENCSDVTLSFVDDFVDLPCGGSFNGVQDLSAYARRVWTAVDESGNKGSCTQYIYFVRKHVADVLFPPDVTVSCSNPVTDPSATGSPYIKDHGQDISLTGNTFCEMQTTYADQILPVCDGTYKILRTWTVIDWCLPNTAVPPFTNPLFYIQVIKVLDNQGPTVTCPANVTVSTDPTNCCASTDLPDVIVSDNCSRVHGASARVTTFDPNTNLQTGVYDVDGSLSDFPNNNLWNPDTLAVIGFTPCVPMGTHIVTYNIEDDCGNTSTCTFRLTVADNTPPVAVCDKQTVVGVGYDGTALIDAFTFDDGSHDNCSQVYFKAHRMASGSCQSNSQFFDQVKFCCSDIGKTITVVLRVYDVTVSGGSVSLTTQELHANDCMVQVFVQDKIKPYCKAPANVAVSCENFDPSLQQYGKATSSDNCCLDTTTVSTNWAMFDSVCSRGTITRTFRAVDCSGETFDCTQRIVVNYEQDYFVKFPNDVIVTACDGTGNYGEPTFFGKDCELLGVSFEDEVFTVVPDACYKIERTWTINNWCTYNPNAGCIYIPNPNPNSIVNHPSNLTGPIVSAAGTAAPWNPTVIALTPGATPTNFSIYWDPNANCYKYKQIIKIIDTQDPVMDCGAPAVTICANTANDAQFWNESYWWDPVHQSHNLCETPADLTISATDLCTKANINFRYLLFLDLDGDGAMETVISSTNPPAAGTVNFGNASNPNFAGGTPRQFDERPVPPNQKYAFTLQTTVSGDTRTAAVRWNTQQAPSSYVTPVLPVGKHKIKWIAEDGCGNETVCEKQIEIKDCKAPTVVCLNGLSINIMPTKMVTLWASDFLQYAEDNCTPSNQLVFGIRKSGTDVGFPLNPDGTPQTSVTFTCDELGTQLVELWAADKAGNADYCETYVIVQDNNGNCSGSGAATVAGTLKTEANQGLEDAHIELTGSHPSLPPLSMFNLSDNQGNYAFNAVPLGANYTVTPVKDNDPLNGVSTFDLVLINKHVLGLEPLSSPYKMIAADANNSRSITTFDVVELRKLILGLYTELPNNTSWRFVDKSYVFPNPSNPFQDVFPETESVANVQSSLVDGNFMAVKVGDVNGNAITSSLNTTDDRSAGILLFDVNTADGKVDIQAGQTFTLRFRAAEQVAGYQFTLYFPNLELVELAPGAGMSAANFGVFPDEHALTTSFDATSSGAAPAEFALTFRAKAAGALSQLLAVSSRITRAEAYRPNAAGEKMDVALRFNAEGGATTVAGLGFELYQNQPNPWLDKTRIGFYLPQASAATLTVYDESGRTLYTQTGDFGRGYNAVTLEHAILSGNGVVYYKLETSTNNAVRKMIQMR